MTVSNQPNDAPLVSVVTPFFNSAAYLDECISSVRAQSYKNIEYILVDNCSTDGSADIARRYAAADERIQFKANERFLGQVENYNQALWNISPRSAFCVIAQADDALDTEHVAHLSELIAGSDSVGVATSYFLEGNRVKGGPVARGETVLHGKRVCQLTLRGELFVFGPPSTYMYRSSIVRSRKEFFDASRLHEDTDVLFRILDEWDLGFSHEILSFVRIGNPSITSSVAEFEPFQLDRFIRVMSYADRFFNSAEASKLKRETERDYLSFLAHRFLLGSGKGFWDYHSGGLETIGYTVPKIRFALYVINELIDLIGNPVSTAKSVLRFLQQRYR